MDVIARSPLLAQRRSSSDAVLSGERVTAQGEMIASFGSRASGAIGPSPVQRVIAFHEDVKPTVQQLAEKAALEHPQMFQDKDFVIYVAPDPELGKRGAAGNTDYGAMIDGSVHLFGTDLAAVYQKAKADKPDKLYAYVTFDPKTPVLDLLAVVAHEMAVHVVPFFAYREILLGGAGEMLETTKTAWKGMVETGALSEHVHHARLGGGHFDMYVRMIKAQIRAMANDKQKGGVVFYFLGDYESKLRLFRNSYLKSQSQKQVATDESTWLLKILEPFEAKGSDKSKLATGFDAILGEIEKFRLKRKAAGNEEKK